MWSDKPCYCPNTSRQSRKTWIREYGEIDGDLQVLHHCDNLLCIEITHLYLGTAEDNTADMFERGRSGSYKQIKITQDIINRYAAGESTTDLAKEVGCHRNAIPKAARDRFGVHVGSGRYHDL